jgi:hypothetical protein
MTEPDHEERTREELRKSERRIIIGLVCVVFAVIVTCGFVKFFMDQFRFRSP